MRKYQLSKPQAYYEIAKPMVPGAFIAHLEAVAPCCETQSVAAAAPASTTAEPGVVEVQHVQPVKSKRHKAENALRALQDVFACQGTLLYLMTLNNCLVYYGLANLRTERDVQDSFEDRIRIVRAGKAEARLECAQECGMQQLHSMSCAQEPSRGEWSSSSSVDACEGLSSITPARPYTHSPKLLVGFLSITSALTVSPCSPSSCSRPNGVYN
ncbi:hypothetical protein P7K49_014587 [Saguinus oedipus]|uniref:Uncharacterized protein n=1 Tax=Saguinus oedipus TaxID=9490 RepID=A0ABQ9V6S9_SAGOE|nr:hypothetical protein P7K49_014587 [Saguinus oedipus]